MLETVLIVAAAIATIAAFLIQCGHMLLAWVKRKRRKKKRLEEPVKHVEQVREITMDQKGSTPHDPDAA